MTRISLIAALGRHTRAIGRDGGLIWNLPDDLARFKRLTMGHPVIMGRRTWDSLPEKFRPLPGRSNLVVSRTADLDTPGAIVCSSLDSAIGQARELPGSEEIFVIGGGQLYAEALPLADRLYLTLVDDNTLGDTAFPEYKAFTKVVEESVGEENGLSYTMQTIEK